MPKLNGIHNIAFYSAVLFIAGVALASLKFNVFILIAFFAGILIANLFLRKDWKWLKLGLVIFIGFFYFNFHIQFQAQNIPFDETQSLDVLVITDPKRGFNHQDFFVDLEDPFSGRVHVYTNPYPEFNYGDLLRIEGTIKPSLNGIEAMMSFPKLQLVSKDNGSYIKSILFEIKNSLLANIKKILPGDKAALASGILLGERSEFTEEFKEAMSLSGTTHIVALSGFNISIIGIVISSLLVYLFPRRQAFYLALLAIILFVLMTGAESSVVRAAIMGIIAMIAEQSSRIHSMRNAITLTALAMVIVNPTILVFDVSFQLSFLALLGIVYIEPKLRNLFGIRPEMELSNWKKNLLQTSSAQLAVMPVAFHAFGYISPTSLISNVLILEFIPITMFLVFVSAVLGLIFVPLSSIVGWLAGIFLGYEIFIINLFGFNRL